MFERCPYVFCPQCKKSNSWVRDEKSDVRGAESGELLWKGWKCEFCGDIAKEPIGSVRSDVKVAK